MISISIVSGAPGGAPNPVSNLRNTTFETSINWTWANPTTGPGFDAVEVYVDNVFQASYTNGRNYHLASDLKSDTSYEISIRTKKSPDRYSAWVNQSTRTAPDRTPPGSITNLTNISYSHDYINWTWTEPIDTDYSHVMVYMDDIFMKNVTKGNQTYNATGLAYGTQYNISTRTVDNSGNINQTWKNGTAWTAPDSFAPHSNIILSGDRKSSGWYATFVQVILEAADDVSGVNRIEYNIDNTAWTVYIEPLMLGNGETFLQFRSIDNAGNSESIRSEYVYVDTIIPQITVNNVSNEGVYNTSVSPEILIFDVSFKDVSITLNGLPYVSGTTITEDGIYFLNVTAIDQTGHFAEVHTRFRIDRMPPASVTNLTETRIEHDHITWAWTDSQDLSYVMVYLDGIWKANVPGGIQSFDAYNLNSLTQYNISTRTVDEAGNINQTWVNRSTNTSAPPLPFTCDPECGLTIYYVISQ